MGAGGTAHDGRGGGVAVVNNTGTTNVTIGSSAFTGNQVLGGQGTNGDSGGSGSSVFGGGLDISAISAGAAMVANSSFTNNILTAGNGGIGGPGGFSGGNGGSVQGGGFASQNYNLSFSSTVQDGAPVTGNILTAGTAGAGGLGGGAGGNGGAGGTAEGGGVAFTNTTGATLTFSFTNNSASNNTLTGGAGGKGGDSGPGGGPNHVKAGIGGVGGVAEGGGIYIFADAASLNSSMVNGATLDYNSLTGGSGGLGGNGEGFTRAGDGFASGGDGGMAAGGGLYNNGLNTTTSGTLIVNGATAAGNTVDGGVGGDSGTGSTGNGGNGGDGGNGGSGFGGGLYEGDNAALTVNNSTFGGFALDGSNKNVNTLDSGNGGAGGNGGTAGKTLVASNGGNGGVGGSVGGAGVFVDSGAATLTNDTIVNNIANLILQTHTGGAGGASGQAAGNGTGVNGVKGNNGIAGGGGYFSQAAFPGSVNKVGNTIIDLNTAGSTLTGTYVPTDPDVFGAFTDKGNNIFGTVGANATGLNGAGDQIGVTAAQLKLGPLLNNGGPSPTDGELAGSLALGAGNMALAMTAGLGTDQRGTGFPRFNGTKVDVGAFELLLPTISSLSPPSANEGDPTFELTINGTGFQSGATVTFGNLTLTPDSITGAAIMVQITSADLRAATTTGLAAVVVNNPDASGLTGASHVVASNSVNFTVNGPSVVPITSPGDQTNKENDPVNLTISSTDTFANSYTDLSGGVHTLPPGLTISSSGVITGTINPYDGDNSPYLVVISAQDDGTVGSTTFNWIVTKTTPPSVTNPGTLTAAAGASFTLTLTSNEANTFTDVVGGVHTLPGGLSIDNTGKITGTPLSNDFSSYNVTITATRTGAAATTKVTFLFNITGATGGMGTGGGSGGGTAGPVNTVVLKTDGSLVEFVNGAGSPQMLSGPGTIKAVSTVLDSTGQTVIFALTTGGNGAQYNNTLWEFSQGAWSQQTDAQFQFQQISAATNSSGKAIVFGVTTNQALYEGTFFTGVATENQSMALLSGTGTIKYVSAVTDAGGAFHAYAIVTADNTLWANTNGAGAHINTNGNFTQVVPRA